MSLLVQYSALQLLDLLTTMTFLSLGVQEGNPVVVQAIQWADNPFSALVGVKAMALAIGLYCWSNGRHALLRRVNWLFAGLVTWNAAAIYMAVNHIS